MKTINLLIFVLIILPTSAFTDGGIRRTVNYFHYFEQEHNLEYFCITDTLVKMNDRGKEYKEVRVVNIGIYDISKDSSFLLFNNENVFIKDLIFESKFDDSTRFVFFNNSNRICSRNRVDYVPQYQNNCELERRSISDNLIIYTYDAEGNRQFYTCTKQGKNLKLRISFPKDWLWELDVRNQSISAYHTSEGKLELRNFRY